MESKVFTLHFAIITCDVSFEHDDDDVSEYFYCILEYLIDVESIYLNNKVNWHQMMFSTIQRTLQKHNKNSY